MTTTSPKPFTLAERDNGQMTDAEVQDLFIVNLYLYFKMYLDLYVLDSIFTSVFVNRQWSVRRVSVLDKSPGVYTFLHLSVVVGSTIIVLTICLGRCFYIGGLSIINCHLQQRAPACVRHLNFHISSTSFLKLFVLKQLSDFPPSLVSKTEIETTSIFSQSVKPMSYHQVCWSCCYRQLHWCHFGGGSRLVLWGFSTEMFWFFKRKV